MKKWPTELIEELAALEHDRWSGWERYRDGAAGQNHHSGEANTERWKRQRSTKYSDLSDAEKESDRDEVWRTLAVLEKHGVTADSSERDKLQKTLDAVWDVLEVTDQEHAEGYLSAAVAKVVGERDRQRADAAEWREQHENALASWAADNRALVVDRDRLRAELERIAADRQCVYHAQNCGVFDQDADCDCEPKNCRHAGKDESKWCHPCIAAAALAGQGPPPLSACGKCGNLPNVIRVPSGKWRALCCGISKWAPTRSKLARVWNAKMAGEGDQS